MKIFLFTSADRDNETAAVRAKDKKSAITMLAISRLDEELIDQQREDEGQDKLFTESFRDAVSCEEAFILDVYSVQEMTMLTADKIKLDGYGKYENDARSALANL